MTRFIAKIAAALDTDDVPMSRWLFLYAMGCVGLVLMGLK